MIRIVGIQRDESPDREFILLQNQGGMRINLRGHVIVSQSAIEASDLSDSAHAFNEEALIPPGMFVLLSTGCGTPRWSRTKDGTLVYYTYMNREIPVWLRSSGSIHMLSTHHTYCERGTPVPV